MNYKRTFKRTYNDLIRFDELYDINFSENQIKIGNIINPKLKLY